MSSLTTRVRRDDHASSGRAQPRPAAQHKSRRLAALFPVNYDDGSDSDGDHMRDLCFAPTSSTKTASVIISDIEDCDKSPTIDSKLSEQTDALGTAVVRLSLEDTGRTDHRKSSKPATVCSINRAVLHLTEDLQVERLDRDVFIVVGHEMCIEKVAELVSSSSAPRIAQNWTNQRTVRCAICRRAFLSTY